MESDQRLKAYNPAVAFYEESYKQELLRQAPVDRRRELEEASVQEILYAKKQNIAIWDVFRTQIPKAFRVNYWHAGCRLPRPECSGRPLDPDWALPFKLHWDMIHPEEPKCPEERRLKHDLKFLEGIHECRGFVRNEYAAEFFPTDCSPAEKENKIAYLAGKLTGEWTGSRLQALHARRAWREFLKFLTAWGREHLSRYHGSSYVVGLRVIATPWRINWKADKCQYVDWPEYRIPKLEVQHSPEVTLGHLVLGQKHGLIESIDVELRVERPWLSRSFTAA
ncbi:hypothetical protein GGR57DRAFT_501189 [Xylariaceae sp. FL1272]|nr:hypothetical protein GGR57DRAFT_501189 [Xylariaceae sp. FL1272]